MNEKTQPNGMLDRPPTVRFWLITFAVIASVAIVVALIITVANANNSLHEKARKLDASQACETMSAANPKYYECKEDAWGEK